MTMPYPSSPNEPGQPSLPPVHAPGPQRIHEPIPVEPIHPELPDAPPGPLEPNEPREPPNVPPGGGKRDDRVDGRAGPISPGSRGGGPCGRRC
jgi:hypothetical protein